MSSILSRSVYLLVQLTCVARIYQVYEQSAERLLEDELPNMLASASASPVGLPVNHFHALYDHQFPASSYHHHHHEGGDHPGGAGYPDTVGGGGDFDNQNSDAYMTQLQGKTARNPPTHSHTLTRTHGSTPLVMGLGKRA